MLHTPFTPQQNMTGSARKHAHLPPEDALAEVADSLRRAHHRCD
jgi:hypothetical protein